MKVMHVIRREYVENVRRRSFVISTIVTPLLLAILFVVPVIVTMYEPNREFRVTVIDQTGVLAPDFVAALTDTLQDGSRKYLTTVVPVTEGEFDAARDAQTAALQHGDTDILLIVPQSTMTGGSASYITREERNYNVLERFKTALGDAVLRQRLAAEGLDNAQVRELTAGVDIDMNQLTDEGSVKKRNFVTEYGIMFMFVMILYWSILSWGTTIGKSIVEEKGSRIVEVLLSTLTPRDLVIGKLIGVGLAGITQFAIWAITGLVLTGSVLPLLLARMGPLDIQPIVFLYAVLFFVLGFLLFAALYLVMGAMSTTEQDLQQLQVMITLPMIIPMLMLLLIAQNPNSGLAVVMSLIPVLTPMIMMARIILLTPPGWQIALSLGLLVVSIYVAVTFAARVFRVGILMHGKRPTIRELVHWYRMAG